ncbi:MAG: amylo-alpha-1,6-glucosidase [Fimbriimonadales bacterium]|nr:amylo-alpha-1,6-glucosidase [Fimbriimonadales bacterium]
MAYHLDGQKCRNLEFAVRREWLLTNGLGGYAMGTVSGIHSRRYHGLLVAAVRPPVDRMVLLAKIEAFVHVDGHQSGISTNQYAGAIHPEGYQHIESFDYEDSVRWVFRCRGATVEQTVAMRPGANSTTIRFRNTGERPFGLTLKPLVCHKPYHGNFLETHSYPEALAFPKDRTVIEHAGIVLSIRHDGAQRSPVQGWYYRFEHFRETERGLNPRDDLFCPCELFYDLLPGESAVLVASVEGESDEPFLPPIREDTEFGRNLGPTLRKTAERFLVDAPGRRTIIAGYPWFGDWGRDTMISLPGLCLATGRVGFAKDVLRSYMAQVRDGLLPNRFVENADEAEFNTVDATLWFANAVFRTLEADWDEGFAKECLACLTDIIRRHQQGTRHGIRVDPSDGLLTQGEPGIQLTWMDAKVGDWVVTPRHGKPVEVNGLWINALRATAWIAERLGESGSPYLAAADRAEASFETKFYLPQLGHYADTADPLDASLRPNQVIPMALPFGPAKGENAQNALRKVMAELYTPRGLRTLGPNEPAYRGRFQGSLPELDAAYHQGTVWPWLLGPYCTALARLLGERQEVRRVLRVARDLIHDCGLGGVAEVYDGDEPQNPGGCPFQAWSVGELLRVCTEESACGN